MLVPSDLDERSGFVLDTEFEMPEDGLMCEGIVFCQCVECGDRYESGQVVLRDIKRHHDGALVQAVWPDKTPQQRDVLVGFRAGTMMCGPCLSGERLFEQSDVRGG